MMTDDSDTRKGASDMDAHEEFERCAWGEMSGAYEANFGRITVQASDALLSAANVKSGTALLEVACGTGNISNVARKAGAEVIGIDFVHGMITEAKRLHPHIDFRVGDAQALPFDDNTFDAVVCNFGVHHFSDPLRALNEAFRVLKVGGEYAFTVWSPPNDVSINFRQIIREAVTRRRRVHRNLHI
jgi:ubiquinone/menaquinone biosynthesis C-methylase UbiE